MNDNQLVQRAQQGDHDAFATLVAQQQQRLYRLCYRITGNAEDAEDLAHDTFVEAFLKLAQLREPERFAGWLRMIALNLYRMSLRRATLPQTELPEEIAAPQRDEQALAKQLSQGLAELSPPHRLALVLHYLEGLSYEEIAIFLDVPIGTVMSRLHRGRHELKRVMERLREMEIPMLPEEDFTKEVAAETRVLLEMFQQDPSAAERLSVLLERSPERLAHIISDAADTAMLDNLALLLRRLGRPAIEITLNCALTGEPTVREHALHVLHGFVSQLRLWTRGGPALTHMPPMAAYLLLDALIRSTADARVKAQLLVALLEESADEPLTALLTNVLLGSPDAALQELLARFRSSDPVSIPVLAALGRMGTRFVATLLNALAGTDPQQQMLALTGMEAFAKSLNSRHGEPTAHNLRTAPKWAPIPPTELDAAVISEATARVAALLGSDDAAIRNQAIRVIGLLLAREYREQLATLTTHPEASTRLAALRALADLGEQESLPVFLAALESDVAAERLAAVSALGRLQAGEAIPGLLARLEDSDLQVRLAAISTLGDLGGDDAKAALQRLTRSTDKAMMKAAARALHTNQRATRPVPDRTALLDMEQRVKQKTLGEAVNPPVFISLPAAIAALPEIRSYSEREVTRYFARAVIDYATTRRQLIMDKLMRRDRGIYQLTDTGEAVWRVEQFIRERYLA